MQIWWKSMTLFWSSRRRNDPWYFPWSVNVMLCFRWNHCLFGVGVSLDTQVVLTALLGIRIFAYAVHVAFTKFLALNRSPNEILTLSNVAWVVTLLTDSPFAIVNWAIRYWRLNLWRSIKTSTSPECHWLVSSSFSPHVWVLSNHRKCIYLRLLKRWIDFGRILSFQRACVSSLVLKYSIKSILIKSTTLCHWRMKRIVTLPRLVGRIKQVSQLRRCLL